MALLVKRKPAWEAGLLSRAEGEGFEPSTDLTARNGFRDNHQHGDLQGFLRSCASLCASERAGVARSNRTPSYHATLAATVGNRLQIIRLV
jgi:hypothetical protein